MKKLILLLVSLTACNILEPTVWEIQPIPIEPLEWYVDEWEDVQSCVGNFEMPFERLRWYTVEGDVVYYKGKTFLGVVLVPNEIVIASDHLTNHFVVAHEMLHLLIGDPEEQSEYWLICLKGKG